MIIENTIKLVLKPVILYWYGFLSKKCKTGEFRFLNYGFDNDQPVDLLKEDEAERYPLQLYHHLLSSVETKNRDILEVGCGRGGGSSYIARYFAPGSIKAVDISREMIDYCRSVNGAPVCEYIQADAEKLPFGDHSFDVALNIESSLYYPDINKFFSEIYRVLKPGGRFLYADFRYRCNIASLREALKVSSFEIVSQEDITKAVVKALEKDSERRISLINQFSPGYLSRLVCNYAGVRNFGTYKAFDTGRWTYFFYVLKKTFD